MQVHPISLSMSASTFEGIKTKNELNIAFKDFPGVFASMLGNCGTESGNTVELRLSHEGGGRLSIVQRT